MVMVMTLPKTILRLHKACIALTFMVMVTPALMIPAKSAEARDYIMRDHIVPALRH